LFAYDWVIDFQGLMGRRKWVWCRWMCPK